MDLGRKKQRRRFEAPVCKRCKQFVKKGSEICLSCANLASDSESDNKLHEIQTEVVDNDWETFDSFHNDTNLPKAMSQETHDKFGSEECERFENLESEFCDETLSFDLLQCFNCHRRVVEERSEPFLQADGDEGCYYFNMSIEMIQIDEISFRKKFCLFKKCDVNDDDEIPICKECIKAISKGIPKGNASEWTWPAFMWSVLQDQKSRSAHGDDLWSLVPLEWRPWWLDLVQEEWIGTISNITLYHPPPYFKEVTSKVEICTDALEQLKWVLLCRTVDSYLSIPHVRCLWGCSKFFNHARTISLDVVFAWFLNDRKKDLMMCTTTTDCMIGARPDFLQSGHYILENPEWCCYPSIVFQQGRGPVVLTCSNHGNGSALKYICVPTNPIGTVTTDSTDQIAPVVARPKTVHTVKAQEYSNAFQMNRITGTYEGIDSLMLTNQGQFNINNKLSNKLDALAVAARSDLAFHLKRLAEHKIVPEHYSNETIEFAADTFPASSIKHATENHCSGATFITMEDCIELELSLRQHGGSVVTINSQEMEELGTTTPDIHLQGSWPPLLVCVHPVNSWGAPFPVLPKMGNKKSNLLSMWVISSVISCVPQVWKTVVRNVISTAAWHGWMLTYLTRECFPSMKNKATKRNPFMKPRTEVELYTQFFNSLGDGNYTPRVLETLFTGLNDVKTVSSSQLQQLNWDNIHENVVMIYHDWESYGNVVLNDVVDSGGAKCWEARLVVATNLRNMVWEGMIYSRHGSVNFPRWWVQHRGDKKPRCVPTDALRIPQDVDLWDVCVFVNTRTTNIQSLKEKYLLSMGGQVKVKCGYHRLPLVMAPTRNRTECYACSKESFYMCPFAKCATGICQEHYDSTNTASFIAQQPTSQETNTTVDAGTSSDDDYSWSSANDVRNYMDQNDEDDNAYEDSCDLEADLESHFHEEYYNEHAEEDVVDPCLAETLRGAVDSYLMEETLYLDDDAATGQKMGELLLGAAMPCVDDCITCKVFETDHLEASECDNDKEEFPTTNAGRRHLVADFDQSYIGTHVIFNKHGRLLIRNRRQLIGTRLQRNFLQRLVATSEATTIPLVYPKAMVFPSIFWTSMPDGAMVGSIPSALLADDTTLKRFGFASLQDHYRVRLKDTSLLTSTDHRYNFFALDACLNLGMRGQDSRVLLSRGFGGFSQGVGGVKCQSMEKEEQLFDSESIDSRPVVNKLAAAMGDTMPALFYTHTCSMKTHYGIRVIKKWLDSDEALDRICKKIDDSGNKFLLEEKEQVRRDLIQSSCILSLRCWINVLQIFMVYIRKSNKKPIGDVVKFWCRFELQEAEANVPHMHSIIWLKENDGTEEGREKILSHIRASRRSMVSLDEQEEYIRSGVVSSKEELILILDNLAKMLVHKHTRRCMIPDSSKHAVHEIVGSPDSHLTSLMQQGLRCKVRNNHLISPNPNEHCFMKVDILHSDAALAVLKEIDLADSDENDNNQVTITHPRLVVNRHVPPTDGGEGILSPALFPTSVYNPCSNNVQYMDSFSASRYVAKYAAGIDESNRVYLRSTKGGHHIETVRAEAESVGNTKITSVMFHEEKKANLERRQHRGRRISQPEAGMLLLGIPQVYTDIKFVHISTVPLEERPAFDRVVPIGRLVKEGVVDGRVSDVSDIDAQSVIPSHTVRNHPFATTPFDAWRQFKLSALMIAKDQLLSPYSVDGVTIFGLRPPELLFINRQDLYFQCFERFNIALTAKENKQRMDNLIQCCQENIHFEYKKCAWIDATTKQVKVRAAALPKVIDYIQHAPIEDFGSSRNNKKEVRFFFLTLQKYFNLYTAGRLRSEYTRNTWHFMQRTFLCSIDETQLPVIWYTSIKPTQPTRFLIHILLSMGEFSNEMEMMQTGSVMAAFIHARLYDPSDPHNSISNLTQNYILKQLLHQPGGTPQFDRFVVAAHTVFKQALLYNSIPAEGLPPFLYTHLTRHVREFIQRSIDESFQQVGSVTLTYFQELGIPNLPSLEQLLTVRKEGFEIEWDALRHVPRGNIQPVESFEEQQQSLLMGTKAISQYMNVTDSVCPKCVCVVGDPGSGKTTVVRLLALHAMCRRLNVYITTTLSERALKLGGRHLHYLFCIPVRSRATPGHLADLAIQLLSRRHERLELLCRLDILIIDELGEVSAEMLGVLDIILRRICQSSAFMGGLLLICSMDVLQLNPVSGRPPLLSPHMLTSFSFARLHHSVRAAGDPTWQRIQKITRLLPDELTTNIIKEFEELVSNNCTFVESSDSNVITKSSLFVYGKKTATNKAQAQAIKKVKQAGSYVVSKALDEESTIGGNWVNASHVTTKKLDKACKEPSDLYFFPGALYEITYNQKDCFSQSQLAILMDMPTDAQLSRWEPIEVYVSPLGNKLSPPEGVTKEQLIQLGWTVQKVGISHENQKLVAERLLGRRRQYGLRPRIASTIHAVLGQELSSLVTQVDMDDPMYSLWERAQVVVLLSRTRTAKDTIFVGSWEVTIKSLTSILLRTTQYTKYICYLLNVFTRSPEDESVAPFQPTIVDQQYHPYRPIDIELPMDNSGCCYILVSCKDTSTTYIGQTQNLSDRIDYHNTGHGSDQTKSLYLRPWAVLAYVVGFGGDVRKRISFEEQWKHLRQSQTRSYGRSLSAVEVADLALSVIQLRRANNQDEDLWFVRTGTVSTLPSHPPQAPCPIAILPNLPTVASEDNNDTNVPQTHDRHIKSVLAMDTTTTLGVKRQHRTTKNQQKTKRARKNAETTTLTPKKKVTPLATSTIPPERVSERVPTGTLPAQPITNRPLTLEEIELAVSSSNISEALQAQLCQNLSVLPTRTSPFITYRDYKSLADRAWLTDMIIMYFMDKCASNYQNVEVFTSFQYSLWRDNHISDSNFLTTGSQLHRFLCRRGYANHFYCNIWLFPLHEHYHWQLLIIANPLSDDCKIMLLDSLLPHHTGASPNTEAVKLFSKQLTNTAVRFYNHEGTASPAYVTANNWVSNVVPTQQPNGYDCGIFTILFGIKACENTADVVAAEERQSFRHWFSINEGVSARVLLRNELKNDILETARSRARNVVAID